MSYRELWVLIKGLPADSLTQTQIRDSKKYADLETEGPTRFGPWALHNYQLAQLRDEVATLAYVMARWAGSKDWPEPKPTPRPGLELPRRVQSDAAVIYLNQLRAKG